MTYPQSLMRVRDRFYELDKNPSPEYLAAEGKFLRRAKKEKHAHFSGPGPGSPVRWVIFSVHHYLFPDQMELPPSYEVEELDEEYRATLSELARYYSDLSIS